MYWALNWARPLSYARGTENTENAGSLSSSDLRPPTSPMEEVKWGSWSHHMLASASWLPHSHITWTWVTSAAQVQRPPLLVQPSCTCQVSVEGVRSVLAGLQQPLLKFHWVKLLTWLQKPVNPKSLTTVPGPVTVPHTPAYSGRGLMDNSLDVGPVTPIPAKSFFQVDSSTF